KNKSSQGQAPAAKKDSCSCSKGTEPYRIVVMDFLSYGDQEEDVGNRVFSFSTRDPEVAGIRDSIELCTADNLRKQELARVRYIARKSNTRWLSGKGDSVITYCFYEKTKAVKLKYSEDSRTPRIASDLATLIKLAQNFEATKVGAPTIGVYK